MPISREAIQGPKGPCSLRLKTRRLDLKNRAIGEFASRLKVTDGCGNPEGQGQNQAGGEQVAAVEGQASGDAGHQAGEGRCVHAAGIMGDDPDGVVGGEEEGGGSEHGG